jgi:hypothetical protein
MTYTLTAFGCEMIVGKTERGTWTGGYRELSSKNSPYLPVGEWLDATTAKRETCKSVQRIAHQVDEMTVTDPCEFSLNEWLVS